MTAESDGFVDLTHTLTCTITDWKMRDGHVEYVIECKRLLGDGAAWTVERRYSEFHALTKQLEWYGVPLGLPPKKYFGNTKDRFIKERISQLQTFLNNITVSPILYASALVVNFLDSERDADKDVRSAFLTSLRNRREWSVVDIWENVGWRSNKMFASVSYWSDSSRSVPRHLVSWMPLGVDHCRDANTDDLNEMLQVIRELNNPYINEVTESWADRRGIGVVNPIIKFGTLRDHLYKSRADEPFFVSYGFDRQVYTLEQVDVCFIGRQVLEALAVLLSIPVPFVSLHCGNILVTDTGCELIDVQFALCGQPNLYRPAMVRSAAVKNLEDMMVFAFGEFLYELLTGFIVFPDHAANEAIALCPASCHSLLQSIFQPTEEKIPTIAELMRLQLFANIPVVRMSKKEITLPTKTKKMFDNLTDAVVKRLNEDRRKLKASQKANEWNRFVNSENQKIKRKKIIQAEQLMMSKKLTYQKPKLRKDG